MRRFLCFWFWRRIASMPASTRSVGWVERSETHQLVPMNEMMGIASLHPSYEGKNTTHLQSPAWNTGSRTRLPVAGKARRFKGGRGVEWLSEPLARCYGSGPAAAGAMPMSLLKETKHDASSNPLARVKPAQRREGRAHAVRGSRAVVSIRRIAGRRADR